MHSLTHSHIFTPTPPSRTDLHNCVHTGHAHVSGHLCTVTHTHTHLHTHVLTHTPAHTLPREHTHTSALTYTRPRSHTRTHTFMGSHDTAHRTHTHHTASPPRPFPAAYFQFHRSLLLQRSEPDPDCTPLRVVTCTKPARPRPQPPRSECSASTPAQGADRLCRRQQRWPASARGPTTPDVTAVKSLLTGDSLKQEGALVSRGQGSLEPEFASTPLPKKDTHGDPGTWASDAHRGSSG